MIRFLITGEPKVYVRVDSVTHGNLLLDKNIIVTGASSGIGYEIAKKCLLEGGNALCVARNEEKLIAALEKLKVSTGSNKVQCLPWDIANIVIYKEKSKKAIELLGGHIDCLVNSAGITSPVSIENCTPEQWDDIFNINLKGLFFLTSEFIHQFVTQGSGGNVVMIASQAGLNAQTRPYALTKAAIIHLSAGLAKEYISNNIRVNAIAPGPTVSDMLAIDPNGDLHSGNRGKRVFRSEEIAETALFLLSNASNCITGEVIACNGGNSIRTDAFC
jgi:NAD(P)-dependent dehydrogenase (short-subunit alcohol dehydrogenase family)